MKTPRSVHALALASIAFAVAAIPAGGQQLTVESEAGKQTTLSRADIEALPHIKIAAVVHNLDWMSHLPVSDRTARTSAEG